MRHSSLKFNIRLISSIRTRNPEVESKASIKPLPSQPPGNLFSPWVMNALWIGQFVLHSSQALSSRNWGCRCN